MLRYCRRLSHPPFADTLIESVTNKKVREIFAEDGEDNFREIETQVLAVSGPCTARCWRWWSNTCGACLQTAWLDALGAPKFLQ